MHLFHEQGYEATGMAEILRAAGVNSGSMYHFFRTKEALLLAVLDRYVELLHPEVMDPVVRQEPDPIGRVFVLLAGYRQLLEMSEFRAGCPIGNLALEVGESSPAARERIALNFEGWRVAVRGFLEDAGDRLPRELDRDQLATQVLTVMEGAVMLARSYRSLAHFDAAVAMLRDHFTRLESAAAADVGSECGSR